MYYVLIRTLRRNELLLLLLTSWYHTTSCITGWFVGVAAVGVPPAPDGAPTKPLTNGDVPHTPASSPPPLVNGETVPSGGDEGKPAETDDESNDEKDVKKDEKDGKKDEKDGKKDEKDDEKDSMMQDLGFIIKIVAPNMEPFDLPVSGAWRVTRGRCPRC